MRQGTTHSEETIEKMRASRRRYKADRPWLEPYGGTRARAKLLGVAHSITRQEFVDWYTNEPKVCVYCDKGISVKTERRMDNARIDRKENDLGYVEGNICLACNRCNTVKGNVFTFDQMREIAQKYLVSA